jgi:hypothetical protein
MRLNDSPQVEHVVAQDIDPSKALDWDNLLLACGPCNRTKTNKPCPPSSHYLPQFHNTHLAFEYSAVMPNTDLEPGAAFVFAKTTGIDPGKAKNTINLCALNRDTTRVEDQATDLRWKYRYEAIAIAKIWRNSLEEMTGSGLEQFVDLLQTVVEMTGFWSIWFNTFEDIQEVRKMLVQKIPGTDPNSFDRKTFLPIPKVNRPNGDLV